MKIICNLRIVAACACLLATGMLDRTDGATLGKMQADKILFLGNSITFCPQPSSEDWWGLSATTPAKDYAHLLTQRINTTTGGSLTIVPPNPSQGASETGVGETRWYFGNPLPNYNGNIINMCDIFELNYNTWDNARIQNQIDFKPDIVVLQIGENMSGGTMEQFTNALDSLLTGLKNSSNPEIFVTSQILGSNPTTDSIKRQICAKDSAHRVFCRSDGDRSRYVQSGGIWSSKRSGNGSHRRQDIWCDGNPFGAGAKLYGLNVYGIGCHDRLHWDEAEVG